MRILFSILLAAILVGCGASRSQVDTALEINKAQATTYTDLAVFTRKVLLAGEKAAPVTSKQFWRDSLTALDTNVDNFAETNRDLMRLILAMQQLDEEAQQRYVDQLTVLVITAKTGKPPIPAGVEQ